MRHGVSNQPQAGTAAGQNTGAGRHGARTEHQPPSSAAQDNPYLLRGLDVILNVQVFLNAFNFNMLKFNKKSSFLGSKNLTY